jgi:hypothetical protein
MMGSLDARADREGQANKPVEATETAGTVSRMKTATCPGASGLRASPDRSAKALAGVRQLEIELWQPSGMVRP